MIINATEFKTHAGKYLSIINNSENNEEIIITRNGKEVAKYNGDRSVDSFLTFVNKKY